MCFVYRCKAPTAICTQSERSTLVATNNGSCAPTYIDGICENMCPPTNKQAINRHENSSYDKYHAAHEIMTRVMTTVTQLQQQRSFIMWVSNCLVDQSKSFTMLTLINSNSHDAVCGNY